MTKRKAAEGTSIKTKHKTKDKDTEAPIRKKCEWPNRCSSLERYLEPLANEGKGLVLFVLTHLPTKCKTNGKEGDYVAGVIFRHTPKDKGVMLNFCPWCGESLQWISLHTKKRRQQNVQEQPSKRIGYPVKGAGFCLCHHPDYKNSPKPGGDLFWTGDPYSDTDMEMWHSDNPSRVWRFRISMCQNLVIGAGRCLDFVELVSDERPWTEQELPEKYQYKHTPIKIIMPPPSEPTDSMRPKIDEIAKRGPIEYKMNWDAVDILKMSDTIVYRRTDA